MTNHELEYGEEQRRTAHNAQHAEALANALRDCVSALNDAARVANQNGIAMPVTVALARDAGKRTLGAYDEGPQ